MKLHYIANIVSPEIVNKYVISPSSIAKANYIKDTLLELGMDVAIFSPVCTSSKDISFSSFKTISLGDNEKHYLPFSFGGGNRLLRLLSYALIYLQLFFYLVFKVRKNDKVLLYHSLYGTKIVKAFNSILRLNLYLELEEIFNAVYHNADKIQCEIEMVNSFANGYIVVNNLIQDKCKISKKTVVCEGQYKMLVRNPKSVVGADGKVHVLYAGVISENADAFAAIKAAEFLDINYVLHIAGYGDDKTLNDLIEKVQIHNNKYPCKVIYHGCLHGDNYEALLSQCSVGLCSRMLEDELSDYTFPSKVFAYLARNLKVVCTPISCVLSSPISDSIVFADSTTPQALAKAILSIPSNEIIDNSSMLNAQHERLINQLQELLY